MFFHIVLLTTSIGHLSQFFIKSLRSVQYWAAAKFIGLSQAVSSIVDRLFGFLNWPNNASVNIAEKLQKKKKKRLKNAP